MIVRISDVHLFQCNSITVFEEGRGLKHTDALLINALLYFMFLLQHNWCQVLMTVLPSKVLRNFTSVELKNAAVLH